MAARHGKQTYRQYLMQHCGELVLRTVKCGMDTATGFGKYVVLCYMLCYVIMKYVMGKEKFQVCKASKLPRVVPTRTRLGLVHDFNMIAFK
ncbi:hypothetical protein TIFTF001_046240 [Ficus carica]|uniref:Uncharacterized protein n=1 Tax=Ficus carica TaxID=3494 RepID=A0AA87Z916_FICCA|nr:hypothetical protein TIFTF001_046228 [Ficus carica]GMN28489.1 hypothetical protein TIFTF001_046240 [Ficus carica]